MRCWRQGKQLQVFVVNRIFQQKAGYPPKHRTKGCLELSWLVIVYKLGGQVFHGLSLKQFMKQATSMKNHWTLEGKRETCMQMHALQTLWRYNLSRPKVLKTVYQVTIERSCLEEITFNLTGNLDVYAITVSWLKCSVLNLISTWYSNPFENL